MESINNKKPPVSGLKPDLWHSNPAQTNSPLELVIANSNNIDLTSRTIYQHLSDAEQTILAKRKAVCAKKEYIVSRYLIKQLAQQYLNVESTALNSVFDDELASLTLKYQGETLPFSLVISHSKGWVAVYLSKKSQRLGIDLEYLCDKRPFIKLAKHFYHRDEVANIESSAHMSDTFFRIWTLKEALAKASAQPIAKLLAPNVFDCYEQYGLSAYSCQLHGFDFSLAMPVATHLPPALVEVSLKSDLTSFQQAAMNRLHHSV